MVYSKTVKTKNRKYKYEQTKQSMEIGTQTNRFIVIVQRYSEPSNVGFEEKQIYKNRTRQERKNGRTGQKRGIGSRDDMMTKTQQFN